MDAEVVTHTPVHPGPVAGPPSIQADRLEVRYRNNLVWKDANLDIREGEFVAVIGPNGAGKTTLFRMLLGLHWPSAGTLKVFGRTPTKGNREIGYVPQRHSIDRDSTLESEVLVRLGATGNRLGFTLFDRVREREAAWTAMTAAGATDLAHRPLGSLSGGELQRIFLAEALVGHPRMLLLDEPLSNLDIRRSRELVETIHQVVLRQKVTTLLVAHDINPMIKCLDRVVYIANGHVATGRPEEVLTSESLTSLYGVRVEVLRDSRNNIVIVGGEDDRGEEGA